MEELKQVPLIIKKKRIRKYTEEQKQNKKEYEKMYREAHKVDTTECKCGEIFLTKNKARHNKISNRHLTFIKLNKI